MYSDCLRILACGGAVLLSSCDVFRTDPPEAVDPYAAASPYAPAAGAGNQGYPSYNEGTEGAYDGANPYGQPAAGGYAQPNYNTPYTQPPAGAGYAQSAPAYQGGNYGAPAGSAGGRTHKIQSGDTLSEIGRRYNVTVDALMRANNLNSTLIKQGQTLVIP